VTRHSFVRSPDLRASTDEETEGGDRRDDYRQRGTPQRELGHCGRGGAGGGHAPRCPPGGGPRSLGQRSLGAFSVPTTKKGYESLLTWAEGFGPVRCAGVEGTSSYGAAGSLVTLESWGSR
jgi:hypothetical protein